MEISKKMQGAINDQINAELFSAYLYLAMAAYFEEKNLKGAAQWMKYQATEETFHAMKFFEYVNERNGRVLLKGIEAPAAKWASPLAAFQAAYEHEKKVTALIYKLVDIAEAEKDRGAMNFLQWYVNEQTEEEKNATEIVNTLEMLKDGPAHALLMYDRELGQRPAPVPPGTGAPAAA